MSVPRQFLLLVAVIVAHLDLDAFFAAVEQLEDPSLRRRPLVVGGDPKGRGVVATANYLARRHGIHSEVVAAIEQSLPEMMAETIAFAPVNEQEERTALAQVESNLAARTMRLCVRLLRMSITQSTPAYDPAVLDPYLPEIIELAGIIQGRRPSSTLNKES